MHKVYKLVIACVCFVSKNGESKTNIACSMTYEDTDAYLVQKNSVRPRERPKGMQ